MLNFFYSLLHYITGKTGKTCKSCLCWWPATSGNKEGRCDQDNTMTKCNQTCKNGCWSITIK